MSVIGSNIIAGASGTVETGYQIARSLRFNSADSAYLNRTFGTATNRRISTLSFWIKKTALVAGGAMYPFAASGDTGDVVRFAGANDLLAFYFNNGTACDISTTQVFRDTSAFYHILVAIDTTQATASNRVRLYVNGSEITSFASATYPTQNYDPPYWNNNTIAHYIGRGGATYMNGYIADMHFIDGQQLTPSSFGQIDSATGVWVPKAYTGTYGTNGFWLKLDDNSNTTAATLGKDSSGNSNNWTPNNFSVTAGVGNDSLVDSPTNYGTDTGAGGEVRGNYCTLNPLDNALTLANGNLQATGGTSWSGCRSTFAVSSGKWYWECQLTSSTDMMVGLMKQGVNIAAANGYVGNATGSYGYSASNGQKYIDGAAGAAYGATWTTADIIGLAFDADAGTLTCYKNNVSQGVLVSGLTSGPYFPAISLASSSVGYINFGQRPFAYTAPSGFKALCTQNLPTPTIGTSSTNLADDYFNVVTYTGTGSSLSVTGVGFQPDLVWIKGRSGATDHALYDAVRGVQKQLESNTTTDETTESTGLTAFGTDGFTVGALAQLNTSAATYVGWNWKESTTSGFDIVTYTGNGANRTISHGLGVAPKMLIVKARTTAGTDTEWPVWHTGIANTNYIKLNGSAASTSGTTYWNSTSPTSSVFSVGTAAAVNTNNDTYVAYLFAEVEGFSKFGSYTGNGLADGPFVYCGFRPKYVMFRRSDSAASWVINDSSRSPYNVANEILYAEGSSAEVNAGTGAVVDFLSNGFKLRNGNADYGASGGTYIFMAFAEAPFNYSRAR